MAKNVRKNDNFVPTFKRYEDMSIEEQNAFRQGAKTIENRVKEKIGLKEEKTRYKKF